MRILVDECLPKRIAKLIQGHDVSTVSSAGWAGKKNGELLTLMESSGYDVFITADQNTQYQQNIQGRRIAVVILVLPALHIHHILPLMHPLDKTLANIAPGAFVVLEA
ncbi:MAG: hypothetical protein SFX19_00775 [Alphaproteobacteria bacterium]|nr:hypothetical protein [Alphaproteobacteria bacterium]